MNRVVVAPDSFKGTASARAVAAAIARGWSSVRPADEVVTLPMADGGEGTLDAFVTVEPRARRMAATVTGPDGRPVGAEWLFLSDGTAVVELALASGLSLLDPLLPLDAHSVGFGQLIAAALDAGASRLVLGIGGSASTDGGAGMLTALGARMLDAAGREIPPGNRGLARIERIDGATLRRLPTGSIALSDVTNPLLGPTGAARVFGPQKGATEADVALMEANLTRFAAVADPDRNADSGGRASAQHSGAAGGVGFGLLLLGVPIEPGARTVGENIGLPAAVASADLVITGEGRFDDQTASGKVAHYVATLSSALGVPTALVAGSVAAPTDAFADAISLVALTGDETAARADTEHWLTEAGAVLARRMA